VLHLTDGFNHSDVIAAGCGPRISALRGSRRTHHNKRTLIRLTLRRYLPEVIEREAQPEPAPRLTSVAPWSRGALLKAYRRVERSWDKVEAAATAAQRAPSMDD